MSDVKKFFRQGADIVLKQVCHAHVIFFARSSLPYPPSAGNKFLNDPVPGHEPVHQVQIQKVEALASDNSGDQDALIIQL
jgi:hypothetical protein